MFQSRYRKKHQHHPSTTNQGLYIGRRSVQDLQPSQAGVDAQRFSLAARSHCDVHDGRLLNGMVADVGYFLGVWAANLQKVKLFSDVTLVYKAMN